MTDTTMPSGTAQSLSSLDQAKVLAIAHQRSGPNATPNDMVQALHAAGYRIVGTEVPVTPESEQGLREGIRAVASTVDAVISGLYDRRDTDVSRHPGYVNTMVREMWAVLDRMSVLPEPAAPPVPAPVATFEKDARVRLKPLDQPPSDGASGRFSANHPLREIVATVVYQSMERGTVRVLWDHYPDWASAPHSPPRTHWDHLYAFEIEPA